MQHDLFRVGVTTDLRAADGSFVFAPIGLEALDAAGVQWSFLSGGRGEVRAADLEGFDAIYHFAAPVTAASLDGVERLALIARHGVGLDFVDIEACTSAGVAVTITPRGVTRPMASAAATLVLALAHRLPERDRALHAGAWGEGRFAPMGIGLTGRTLGLIGYGRIGRETVRLLAPWGMRVLVTSRRQRSEPGVDWADLDALLAESDVVVVACPLTEETRGLLDERRLALMKPSAVLVNVARGAIVDQQALAEALRDGRLAGAGLDVFDPEPLPADDPLLGLPSVIGAPHSLGYTDELVRGCVEEACASLLAVARGSVPANVVNPDVLDDPRLREKLAQLASDRR